MNSSSEYGCVACKGELRLFGRREDFRYHYCLDCGTIQLVPLPDEADLARFYASEYAAAGHHESEPETSSRVSRTYYESMVDTLKKYNVSGMVIDYGAGWGGLCEMLLSNDFQCLGLDLAEEMVAHCRHRGLPVQTGDLSAVPEELKGEMGAIALCHVFEHLVNHEKWLKHAYETLKSNGILVSLQPAAAFARFWGTVMQLGNAKRPLPALNQILCPPWHTVLFSLEGMKTLAARNGFDLVDIKPAPQGRAGGLTEIAQVCLQAANKAGWRLFKGRWPLVTAHIFTLRKK